MSNDQSNMKPLMDALMKDVKAIGSDKAAGDDAPAKLILRAAKAADEGIITLEKDADGKDDAYRIYEAYIATKSKKAVHEHTAGGIKANVSNLRQPIKMVIEGGAKYDGIQTLHEALLVRSDMFKADPKSVRPAADALESVSREQMKCDRQLTTDELKAIVAKRPAAEPSLVKKLTAHMKGLEKIITGEAGVTYTPDGEAADDPVYQAHDLLKRRVGELMALAEQRDLDERLAARGLRVVPVMPMTGETVEHTEQVGEQAGEEIAA